MAPFFLAKILSGYRAEMLDVVVITSEMLQKDLAMALQKNKLDLAFLYDLGLDTQIINLYPLVG